MVKRMLALLAALFVLAVEAAPASVPKVALKALKATRGKPFSAGYVFIDGKYVEPPYTIERYGTILRVNGTPVTGSLVAWEDFVKTQDGVKVSKTEVAPAAGEASAADEESDSGEDALDEEEEDDEDDPLADLFDDEPKPKKSAAKKKTPKRKPRPAQPRTVVSYTLEGEFVMNDKAKALLDKLNRMRTDVDVALRQGGFYCFGKRYSRVNGDAGTAKRVLGKIVDYQKKYSDVTDFVSAMRSSGMVFMPDALLRDLHRNRLDYLKIKRRLSSDDPANELKELLRR